MGTLVKYQNIATKKGGTLLSTSITRRKLEWQCNEGHIFWLTGYKVHRRGKWCPKCGSSNGERAIRQILREFNISFITQYKLLISSRRRYDFYFEYNGGRFIIEYDGEQHFRFARKYHKKKENFLKSQIIDRIKTYYAWNSGITIIRIDYTQYDNIRYHIISGVNSGSLVYLSNPLLYKYITDIKITQEQLMIYS